MHRNITWNILGTRELTAESGKGFTYYFPTSENYSVIGDLREDDWKRSCGREHNDWTNEQSKTAREIVQLFTGASTYKSKFISRTNE